MKKKTIQTIILIATFLILAAIAVAIEVRIENTTTLTYNCDDGGNIRFIYHGTTYNMPKEEWCNIQIGWMLDEHPEWIQ